MKSVRIFITNNKKHENNHNINKIRINFLLHLKIHILWVGIHITIKYLKKTVLIFNINHKFAVKTKLEQG